MQALILAAGYGRRLRPLTDTCPKSLVEVNGIPLLVNALNCISDRDVSEVLVVVGDKKDIIVSRIGHEYKGMKITYIENPRYRETNNVYSLWLAGNYIYDDVIMMECDLFYNRSLIDSIINSTGDCNILVSPFNPDTMDGTVVLATEDNDVTELIIKRDQTPELYACTNMLYKTVNIYRFGKDFITGKFMPAIDNYVKTQSVNSYYELVLGSLIYYRNDKIKAVVVEGSEWNEIDDINDLKRAEEKFR